MHLVAAVTVGVTVGAIGNLIMPGSRRIPFWVPMAAAVGAAVLATITGHLADSQPAELTTGDVVMQVIFAALTISLVAATADRPPARHDRDSRVR
ncbi:hypothetical protein AB0F81_06470 [Actinoplanes sp. NPDC024001]|uniref:hypothetical protein n=1 Tax=Actinoplanes sp. NPDC024001 TaxID=3154598 RepID=UPI0033FEA138